MNLFCRKSFSVCVQCGNHYDPPTIGYGRDYCGVHRPPVIERLAKIDTVRKWAERNWEKLYDQAIKEEVELRQAYQVMPSQDYLAAMARNQAQAAANTYGSLGGLPGGGL